MVDASGTGERAVVAAVADDYARGWYDGDPERVRRALHPDLVKRAPDGADGSLRAVTRDRMVALAEQGGGARPGAAIEVVVDDVDGDIATARVRTPEYLDYLHLARTSSGWRIVDILFHPHPEG